MSELQKQLMAKAMKAAKANDTRDAIIDGVRYSANDLDYLPGWMSMAQYRVENK